MVFRFNKRDLDRFITKINKTETCWLWTASLNVKGYGQFRMNDNMERAHRISFLIHKGEIPKGMLVLHTCDIRHCVNPEHLILGTDADNASDRFIKGRDGSHFKDVCSKGHDTSYPSARNKSHHCKQCDKERQSLVRQQAKQQILS